MTINPGLLDLTGKPALVSSTDDVFVGSTAAAKVTRLMGLGIAGNSVPLTGTATVLGTGGTITPTSRIMRFSNAGAITGVIMAASTQDGQEVIVCNESANSVTFAVVGTSRVLNGVSAVIAANSAMKLVWVAAANTTGAWIPVI